MFSERWPRSSRAFDVHDLFMCFESSLQPHIFSLLSRRHDMNFLRINRVSEQRGQFKKCESGKRSFLLCNGISPNVRVRAKIFMTVSNDIPGEGECVVEFLYLKLGFVSGILASVHDYFGFVYSILFIYYRLPFTASYSGNVFS